MLLQVIHLLKYVSHYEWFLYKPHLLAHLAQMVGVNYRRLLQNR